MKKRVVLGMSGGVDSSVAACLLMEEGLEVLGVSMELYSCDSPLKKGCCTPIDRLDARKICEQFKIPFEILDLRKPFKTHVMEYFASEYSKGRTPLPCAPCNRDVRFKALLEYADKVGAYGIATGHYARIQKNEDGTFSLLRGIDPKKDQSYFLWGLGQTELSRLKLPIGNFSKPQVREMARKWNLITSEKKESQELCFVGDDDHARFLEEHFPEAAFQAGDYVDEAGKRLGKHRGLHAYTIGQRRGLGVALGERRYVVSLNPEKNEVVLGSKDSLKASGLIAKDVHWIAPPPSILTLEGGGIKGEGDPVVRIRSTHPGVEATLNNSEEGLKVEFKNPQEAVTPGQAAVFYQNDVCLGGGWIERAF
ncbi:MAG: tRNA 2-thiouridine(34) synthase MnmA [Deltaproteobacteria bacterium RIFCSPLOWO2_12_FULL_44_12]|nr:MAG: tRNA 2-thiouridine(34) synthase MnmA [Deltaproteobacteria bacterium RIFCSPLOWO2_12_FULL_44_12]